MADLPEDTITSPWLRQTASHTHAIVQGCDGPAALLEAARCGDSAVLAKLLRAGADPNHRQEASGMACLDVVVRGTGVGFSVEARGTLLRLLLAAGADPDDLSDHFSEPPALIVAAETGLREVVAFLITFGANVNIRDSHGRTPLIAAAAHGRREIAADLVEAGAYFEPRNHRGDTAVNAAVGMQHWDLAEDLLRAGGDID